MALAALSAVARTWPRRFILAAVLDPPSPELLERLRVAAPQLGMRQSDIAAAALDGYLRGRGF